MLESNELPEKVSVLCSVLMPFLVAWLLFIFLSTFCTYLGISPNQQARLHRNVACKSVKVNLATCLLVRTFPVTSALIIQWQSDINNHRIPSLPFLWEDHYPSYCSFLLALWDQRASSCSVGIGMLSVTKPLILNETLWMMLFLYLLKTTFPIKLRLLNSTQIPQIFTWQHIHGYKK